MMKDERDVNLVKAQVIQREDTIDLELALSITRSPSDPGLLVARISKLEVAIEDEKKTTAQHALSLVGLQNASLKHTAALSLLLAVLLFVASKALGA